LFSLQFPFAQSRATQEATCTGFCNKTENNKVLQVVEHTNVTKTAILEWEIYFETLYSKDRNATQVEPKIKKFLT
jgi:hypothetical protein